MDSSLIAEISNVVKNILEDCRKFWFDDNTSEIPSSVGQYLHDRFNEYLDSCNDSSEIRQNKLALFDWHIRYCS